MSGALARPGSWYGEPFPIQTVLTAHEYRILYKLLWTAEAHVLNEVFQKILSDRKIIHEVVLTDEELHCADDTISSLIRKLNLMPPKHSKGMGRGLELDNPDLKELPHGRTIPDGVG